MYVRTLAIYLLTQWWHQWHINTTLAQPLYIYIKKLGVFNWSRDYIVDRKKVSKQAGVVHNIKSQ